jgi:hypothetical protein
MKILKYFSLLLIVIGFIGLLGCGLIFTTILDYKYELPIAWNAQTTMSSENKFYVGLPDYGKIQVYDINGKFLFNFKVYGWGGEFTFKIIGDTIQVKTVHKDLLSFYDLKGRAISSKHIYFSHDDYRDSPSTSDPSHTIINGYYIRTETVIIPKIIIEKDGKTTIIKSPLYLNLLKAPFLSGPLFFFGIIIFFSIRNKMKNQVK